MNMKEDQQFGIARWNAGHEKSWAWVKYNINNEYEYLQSDLVLVAK